MKLHINRIDYKEEYTIGRLLIDEKFECNTLEDKVREEPSNGEVFQVSFEKIQGKTAIPAGTYPVLITYSPRFKRKLPEILHVPGFSNIRIHPGNTAEDTEGCILVGLWDKQGGTLLRSRDTFDRLYKKLEDAINQGEAISLSLDYR